MNKSLIITSLVMASAAAFVSCESDRDSNPVLIQPTEFTVNTPAYANEYIDLGNSKAVNLTWSQPKYSDGNAPINITYEIQLANKGSKFTKSFTEANEVAADADYIVLDETFTSCKAALDPSGIAKSLEKLNEWDEEAKIPTTWDADIRVRAFAQEVSGKEYNSIISSNTLSLKFNPYYVSLDVDPEIWYLIGDGVCSGSWDSKMPGSFYPMFTTNTKYNGKGRGEITWSGYLLASKGFKLKLSSTSWDSQWGMNGSDYVKNDGGSGNISVAKDGYYTITLNTATDVLTIKDYEGTTPEVQTAGVALSGDFNSWGDTKMSPVFTYAGAVNHDWYLEVKMEEGKGFKFKTPGDSKWVKLNVGYTSTTPTAWGYGTAGGQNIGIGATGNYLILFNDITNYFRVIALDDDGNYSVDEKTGIINLNYLAE